MKKWMAFLTVFLLTLALSACAEAEKPDCVDTFAFDLQPGEQAAYGETLTFEEPCDFTYQANWERMGCAIEIGLADAEGRTYVSAGVGGAASGVLEKVPAGTYQFFVRSSPDNAASHAKDVSVTGAAGFWTH